MISSQGLKLSSALVVMLAALPVHAAEYYVSPTGSESNPGTQAQPFASMTKAQSVAQPGDTVYLRGGTYAYKSGLTACRSGTATISAIELAKSGASGRPMKYWAYPGEVPIFDFSGIKDSCRIIGFNITGDWIHLKGIELKGVPQNNSLNHESWGVIIDGGNNNILEAMNAHHNMGPGFFIRNNSSNNLVLNCDSHDNNDEHTSNGAGESGDGFGCHVLAGNPGNTFRGCRAWWNTDDGYDLINAESPVTIESSWAWYNGYLPGTMTQAKNGNGFKAGGYGADPANFPKSFAKHTVRDCLATANKGAGFYTNHHPVSGFFYNNTSVGNAPNFNLLGMDTSGNDIHVGVLRNNIAFMGTAVMNGGAGVDDVNNSWTLSVKLDDTDFRGTMATALVAPRQSDGSLPIIADFHLAAGSDLIDKGKDVGLPFVGASPDLGAFEYGAVEDGGIVVNPPSGDAGASGGSAGNGGSAPEAGSRGGAAGGSGDATGGMGGSGGNETATGGSNATGGSSSHETGGSAGAQPGSGNPLPLPEASVTEPAADVHGGCSCSTSAAARTGGAQAGLLVTLAMATWQRRRRHALRTSTNGV